MNDTGPGVGQLPKFGDPVQLYPNFWSLCEFDLDQCLGGNFQQAQIDHLKRGH